MAEPITEHVTDLRYIGGVFAGIENDFKAIDYGPLLKSELDELESIHKSHFDQQVNPAGSAWPPLAPSTIARKGHDTILVETGRLKGSLTDKGSPDAIREIFSEGTNQGATFGTGVEYSIFHDTASGNRPERKHVGINEQQVDQLAARVADETIKKLVATL